MYLFDRKRLAEFLRSELPDRFLHMEIMLGHVDIRMAHNALNSRYQSRKPMIVTTNLTLEELKHPSDLAHEQIYDRLLERCVPVQKIS